MEQQNELAPMIGLGNALAICFFFWVAVIVLVASV